MGSLAGNFDNIRSSYAEDSTLPVVPYNGMMRSEEIRCSQFQQPFSTDYSVSPTELCPTLLEVHRTRSYSQLLHHMLFAVCQKNQPKSARTNNNAHKMFW